MMPVESFVPSEPAKAALISADDSVRAYAAAFPVPLEGETAVAPRPTSCRHQGVR